MQEIITIKGKEPKEVIRKLVKASSLRMYEALKNENRIFICGEELKRERVPETFDELKELCEDLESKDVFITSAGDCIEYHGLQFWVSGTVCHETEKFYSIKSDRTSQQMWKIIMGLLGE